MELIKVINARKVLCDISNDEMINPYLSYWMTKFVAKTESEYEFYISEMRKLFSKYANKAETNDVTIFIPNENVTAFNTAVEALHKTDVEDPGIRFNLSWLSAELKLSMKQMYPLLDFIDENK